MKTNFRFSLLVFAGIGCLMFTVCGKDNNRVNVSVNWIDKNVAYRKVINPET